MDLKKYSFSGYVRTVRTVDGTRSDGIVLLRGGNPEACLYLREDEQDRGRGALRKVWQDSYDESCILELHARVDMDELVRAYGDALLERPAKVVKKAKVTQLVDRAEVEAQLRRWKADGYEVGTIESFLSGEPAALTAAFVSLKEAIRKSEAVREILDRTDVAGFEARAAVLREKLLDPVANPDIDSEVESLRDAIESLRRSEALHRIELERERDSQERTKKMLDLVLKQESLGGSAVVSKEEVAKVLEVVPPERDEETSLIASYAFEAYVVGESNRFAHAAAVAVAKQPARSYNPLLVTSGPGLGKTHLLHAIGNYIASHREGSKVLYLTCEAFITDFENGKENGTLAAFRERVRGVDCLLLDDIQFLSAKGDVHEEIFHTFNELFNADKQIVLASDRPPKAIPDLDDRLVSRFESGLVAGIEPPEFPTRLTILERQAREAKVEIDPDVLAFIANLVEDNVRELGGAFNRVVAFSSLMGRPITQDLAREVLSETEPEPEMETLAEPRTSTFPIDYELKPGRSYLIEEDRPSEAFRLFSSFLREGKGGLVITRTNPKRVRETFGLRTDRILWLTDREGSAEETMAPALERIVYEIEAHMSKVPRGAVMIDGIEYLVSNNSFDAVLKFVRRLLDTVSESQYVFIISLGPATLKDQELKVLEREMDVIRLA